MTASSIVETVRQFQAPMVSPRSLTPNRQQTCDEPVLFLLSLHFSFPESYPQPQVKRSHAVRTNAVTDHSAGLFRDVAFNRRPVT